MTEQILTKKRSHIKAKLTRFVTFLNDCTNNDEKKQEVAARLEKIEEIWKEFDAVQTELEDIDEAELGSGERDSFENKFYQSVTRAKNIISALHVNFVQQEQRAQIANQPINIIQPNKMRLPTIEIPKFDGSWEKWLPFRDTFTSMVHDNVMLTAIDKLHYLRWALVGDAHKLVESLEVAGQNYQIAWDIINKRYKGNKTIIQHHVQAIINFPCISKESHSSLRQFVDTTQQHIRTLKRLEQPTDTWDTLLIQLLIPKLDSNTRREWESERADKEALPTMEEFVTFLETRCSFLDALTRTSSLSISKNQQGHSKQQVTKQASQVQAHASTEPTACPICQNIHRIYECSIFRDMSPQARLEKVKSSKLCYNCLRQFHGRNCTYGSCRKCHKRHHTLMHLDKAADSNVPVLKGNTVDKHVDPNSIESNNNSVTDKNNTQGVNNSLSSCHTRGSLSRVLLSTATIHMRDRLGKLHECRALLDSGSQPNFISREMSTRLGLAEQTTDTKIDGINNATSTSQSQTTATIYSRFNKYQETLSFLIVDKVTSFIPGVQIDVSCFQIPANIKLADPTFHLPGKIDVLLGSEAFWKLLCVGQIQTSKSKPIFQKTKLGWVVSGKANVVSRPWLTVQCHSAQQTMQDQLERFWRLEELPARQRLTAEEQRCEEHFSETHSRQDDGRFIVQLPLKDNYTQLGDSYDCAKRRLISMERKMARQPELKQQYDSFMQEYLNLDHMKPLSSPSGNSSETRDGCVTYYLPHHPVLKAESETTRLRVVFDASAKSSSGLSLNDVQMTGPTIQQDLFNILMRFRKYVYALTADVSKMYRQVGIQREQCRLQRILWRFRPEDDIQTYELQTVTYGEACSAFLAIRSLHQAAKDLQHQLPKASEVIIRDFYVDDLLTGDNDINELLQLKEDVISVLQTAKFELHKWKSNYLPLMDTKQNKAAVQLSEGTRILGQLWDTQQDIFRYTAEVSELTRKPTKRQVLSCISQILDPLGLLGPIIIKAKLIMQQLWQLQLSWDESLPIQLHSQWSRWYAKILQLNHLQIPRRILCDEPTLIEVHGFCDASERAYGACIYIRSTDSTQRHHVKLLCAKSRVAPLKTVTIPRLELCGALLLSQLYQRVNEALGITFDHIHFWCDSTITLSWIAGDPSRWSIFVANRVAEIQKLTEQGKWHHIRSELNPADVLSRGIDPDEIRNQSLWWNGPAFLQEDYSKILDDSPKLLQIEELPEVKKRVTALMITSEEKLNVIERFSSLRRLKRTIAHCLRFIHNTKQKTEVSRLKGPLQIEELEHSMRVLLVMAQREEYADEIRQLSRNLKISSKSRLLSLHPFLDVNGLLRVGGRLQESQTDYDQKHPIILPKSHHLTRLIITEEHLKNLHAGVQLLLAIIRTRYWPISGKNALRKILHKCIVCCRARSAPVEQLMGNLPASRVSPAPPFYRTGVDYAGPFTIKVSRNKTGKAYLCVFVCFVTKAVHLEIVTDLSTSAFLNALKRFIARRGKCHSIYSDNGTNFVGANNSLKEMYKLVNSNDVEIRDRLAEQAIRWYFLPPQSPHMGGLWESAVKACKNHLTKVIGLTSLSFEELTTVATQVEAILNSRPLMPMSADPTDLNALTPGHFLVGRPLVSINEIDLTDVNINRLNRYQLLEKIKQTLWKRWSVEYLTQLQQRNKWKDVRDTIKKGTMVVLRDQNTPPMNWRLGRVVNVHQGKDGLIRVVDVKTSTGVYQRPLTKLCILPIDVQEV